MVSCLVPDLGKEPIIEICLYIIHTQTQYTPLTILFCNVLRLLTISEEASMDEVLSLCKVGM